VSIEKTSVASLSKDLFARRIIIPLAGAIFGAIFMVVGFVIFTALGQNRLEVESSTKLAETALAVNKRQIARALKDYAVWEDAYRYLHADLDVDWAATDGNVGANIYEGLGYEMAFVIDPHGRTVYAVLEGEPREADARDLISSGLDDLIAAGVDAPLPAVGVLRSGSDLMLVASNAIIPPSIPTAELPVESRSTLIFAKRLDSSFLERMSNEYLLRGLRIASEGAPVATASIPLLGPDGETLGLLLWEPAKPGYELLRLLLPPLAICILVLMAFAWLVANNARKTTWALQESARIVEAYAQTLEESESRFRDVAEASSDWIWESDAQLQLMYLSSRFSEVTGIAAASVLGKSLQDCFSPAGYAEGENPLLCRRFKRSGFRDLQCRYRDANDGIRNCRLAARPILDSSGRFIGYRGTATDITEEVEAQARARHLALHDSLTGLPNRVLFAERLNQALAARRRQSEPVAVLCLDLDHFKEVNDTLGHGAGDLLLKEVAARLQTCVRPSDTVARLGGDEFAIIQSEISGSGDVQALSARIIEVIKEPFRIDGNELHVGVSIGVCMPLSREDSPEKLLKNADIALYRAKQAGRGATRFFEAKMDVELQDRKALENDLRNAIARDELDVNYQPVIDLKSQSITGVEALLRWKHPERGMVSPAAFVPIAEDTGLIGSIGEWVLQRACRQALDWPDVRVAVNLSPVQFRQRNLIGMIRQILADTGLRPDRLELEITESVLINDTEAALKILNSLKDIGIKVALDDFGTGFSSLGYLSAFPFDKLKIDRAFISAPQTEEKPRAIVKSVISLGHSLGITTTAEGVETREQMTFLLEQGCEEVQGYLFAAPMSATQTTKFLSEWSGFDSHRGATRAA
jgi:diguanylate cyclase (GGDEF)-like protein/PAS domain S-box-containing protein